MTCLDLLELDFGALAHSNIGRGACFQGSIVISWHEFCALLLWANFVLVVAGPGSQCFDLKNLATACLLVIVNPTVRARPCVVYADTTVLLVHYHH